MERKKIKIQHKKILQIIFKNSKIFLKKKFKFRLFYYQYNAYG